MNRLSIKLEPNILENGQPHGVFLVLARGQKRIFFPSREAARQARKSLIAHNKKEKVWTTDAAIGILKEIRTAQKQAIRARLEALAQHIVTGSELLETL